MYIKRFIKKIFSKLGYEVRRTQLQSYPSAANWNREEYTTGYMDEKWLELLRGEVKFPKHKIQLFDDIIKMVKKNGFNMVGGDILEVGCGGGYFLKRLLKRCKVGSITGIDLSRVGVHLSSVNVRGDFAIDDITYPLWLYSKGKKYSTVFCIEVLEHIMDYRRAFREMVDFTDGILVITVPDGRKDTWQGHIHFWSPESWQLFIGNQSGEHLCECGVIDCCGYSYNYAIITVNK